MKNSIILKKMVILFLIILLPLFLLCNILLLYSNEKYANEAVQKYHMRTQKYVRALDDDINQIYNLAFSVPSRSEIIMLSYLSHTLSTYETANMVNSLRSYIRDLQQSYDLIENIKVYIRATNHVYHAMDRTSYEVITQEEFQSLADLNITSPYQIVCRDGKLAIVIKTPHLNPDNIIEVVFSSNLLIKDFEYEKPYDNSYYLFQFHDGEYILDNIETESLQNRVLEASYKNGINQFTLDGREYFVFCAEFQNINGSFIQVIPSTEFLLPIYWFSVYAILFIFVFLCVLFFFIGTTKLIHRPLVKLVQAFQEAETGNLSVRISDTVKTEFSYLYAGFNNMATNLENLLDEVYDQNMLRQRAEFKQLQAQINPHFLYNSFFMLQRLIQKDMQPEALQVSKELGIYFRYITKNQSDFVFLKDEYQHAKIYSDIQSLRFEGRLRTEFGDLPNAYSNQSVPRLILQPIIENAYDHGLSNKTRDGLLRVSFHSTEEGLLIVIEDNGEDLTDEQLQIMEEKLNRPVLSPNSEDITGLTNIHRRIKSYFRNGSALKVARSELGGLKVTVFLASKESEGEHK